MAQANFFGKASNKNQKWAKVFYAVALRVFTRGDEVYNKKHYVTATSQIF
jgi:hypothetical protein